MHDILIAIAGSIGTLALIALGALLIRVWRTPKRLDRLERIVPPLTRGVWALLRLHIAEQNGETDLEVKEAYSQLTEVVTTGVVSQKSNG